MKDVADFVANLKGEENLIVRRLRNIILDTDPRLQEKLSYGVPYFFLQRRVCFLWPASHLPMGYSSQLKDQPKVTFGLCYGNLLSNVQGLLLKEGRKQFYVIKYSSLTEIDVNAVREIILEAVLIGEEFKKKKEKYFDLWPNNLNTCITLHSLKSFARLCINLYLTLIAKILFTGFLITNGQTSN